MSELSNLQYIYTTSLDTFLIERFEEDLDNKSGLKEWEDEYLVIPHPSIPPPVLLVSSACIVIVTYISRQVTHL